jgi:hypothetical protein
VVLLERGQALWSRSAMSFGSNHYQIRGKAVALLNPFTPFVCVFRTLPLFAKPSGARASTLLRALAPLSLLSAFQLLLVFAALPYCLYRAPGWPFFIALVLAFANAIVMLGFIWWSFRRGGLATRPLVALGFAWLVCLPLSVNAQRKAALAFDVAMDARGAMRALAGPARERARAELAAQIAEAMQELEETDERHRRLAELRRKLAPEASHGRL